MKNRFNLLQLFAALGIVLTLSMFCFSYAAAADALEDNAALLARADAKADTSKFLWFSIGCGSGAVGLYLLGLGRLNLSFEYLIAGGLTGFVPWALSHAGNTPPSDRLLGKSPAYVKVYVAAYQEEKHHIKKDWGGWGVALGALVGAGIFASQLSD